MCPCDTQDWRAGCLPEVLGSTEVQGGALIPLCILLTYFTHRSMTILNATVQTAPYTVTSQCPLSPHLHTV